VSNNPESITVSYMSVKNDIGDAESWIDDFTITDIEPFKQLGIIIN